jgi:hypothetical protein
MNGSAKNAVRLRRKGPRRAAVERTAREAHASASASHAPIGWRLTARIPLTVSRNFSRASARWSGLSRAR